MKRFKKEKKADTVVEGVIEGMKKVYRTKLLPLEEAYRFHDFHSPAYQDSDFDSKPMILLIGQYSTGKTTFIRFLLEQDFPGIRIGPEPTTDRFTVIMHNETETTIPGNALVVDPTKAYRALSKFGNSFLNRLQASCLKNDVLENLTFIDTPGILSGEKQRLDRGYDFGKVLTWFAERVDRIILLFDAHKLDISDEFKSAIELLSPYEEKIRIVLNKADRIDHQQLMRVYGALMWSLGKVLGTPEVARVYIGSYWDEPLHFDYFRKLFELETADLFRDLQMLPRNATVRKLNDLIRRARLAKVHAYIVMELRSQMPVIGKDSKKKELIRDLHKVYEKIHREFQVPLGDFPDVAKMQNLLQDHDFAKFNKEKPKLFDAVETMLTQDISGLMALVPDEERMYDNDGLAGGGALDLHSAFNVDEGVNAGKGETSWIVEEFREEYDQVFDALANRDGKLTGGAAKGAMVKSRLPNSTLARVWRLADVDGDGCLDRDEWALCSYLIKLKLDGFDVPPELPDHLIPPSKTGVQYAPRKVSGR